MFSVGSKIVHPMHGAGIIQKIEEKKILGEVKQYYILKLPCNDMNVMIPVDSEQSVGIREIVDESAVRSAIEILREDSTAMDRNWNRRYRENMQKLKTGDILVVAEVVRNLIRAGRQKSLSAGGDKDAQQRETDPGQRNNIIVQYFKGRRRKIDRRRRLSHWAFRDLRYYTCKLLKKGGNLDV